MHIICIVIYSFISLLCIHTCWPSVLPTKLLLCSGTRSRGQSESFLQSAGSHFFLGFYNYKLSIQEMMNDLFRCLFLMDCSDEFNRIAGFAFFVDDLILLTESSTTWMRVVAWRTASGNPVVWSTIHLAPWPSGRSTPRPFTRF